MLPARDDDDDDDVTKWLPSKILNSLLQDFIYAREQ